MKTKKLFPILLSLICILLFSSCDGAEIPADTSEQILPKLEAPLNLRIDDMEICWDFVDDAKSYKLSINDKEAKTQNLYYPLPQGVGVFEIKVKAIADGEEFSDSDWSAPIKHIEPTAALEFKLLEGGVGYEVTRAHTNPNEGLEGVVVIPDTYRGLPVVKIADSAFVYFSGGAANLYNDVTTEFILPSGLQEIGEYAFYNCKAMTKITIPDGVHTIGRNAFSYCTELSEISLPDSIYYLPNSNIFANCSKLSSVKFPKNLKTIGFSAFARTALSDVTLPDTVEVIGSKAFSNTNIKEIVIPASVTEIGLMAFENCAQLDKITILSKNITKISADPFAGTKWQEAQGDYVVINDILVKYKGTSKSATIGPEIKYIAGGAFMASTIESIVLHEDVTFIGNEIFFASAIKQINLPSNMKEIPAKMFGNCLSLESIVLPEGVETIGSGAFQLCTSLKSISFPSGLKTIDDMAFSGCTSLQSVDLPDGLERLGLNSFSTCEALKTVTIPSSLNMGISCFGFCSSLENVVFLNGIEKLENKVFLSCKKLKSIVIPQSVTRIEKSFTRSCAAMQAFYYQGTAEDWSKIVFAIDSQDAVNNQFDSIPVYFYSETKPTGEGRYWHYVDGVPTVWGE